MRERLKAIILQFLLNLRFLFGAPLAYLNVGELGWPG